MLAEEIAFIADGPIDPGANGVLGNVAPFEIIHQLFIDHRSFPSHFLAVCEHLLGKLLRNITISLGAA
jgi:hypothetical protein